MQSDGVLLGARRGKTCRCREYVVNSFSSWMTEGGKGCVETESSLFLPSTTSGCNSSSIPVYPVVHVSRYGSSYAKKLVTSTKLDPLES